jgi:hypothetical protein
LSHHFNQKSVELSHAIQAIQLFGVVELGIFLIAKRLLLLNFDLITSTNRSEIDKHAAAFCLCFLTLHSSIEFRFAKIFKVFYILKGIAIEFTQCIAKGSENTLHYFNVQATVNLQMSSQYSAKMEYIRS